MSRDDGRRGLPRRPFFYTLDQVAELLSLSVTEFTRAYVWKVGDEVGPWRPRYLRAANLTPEGTSREWRIGEAELLRWLRYTNLYVYDPYLGTDMLDPEERESIEPPDRSIPSKEVPDAELLKL